MTKLQIASDLHLETWSIRANEVLDELTRCGADVLVMAGDLAPSADGLLATALERLSRRYAAIVYVAGNHDYYGSSPAATHAELRATAERLPNVHWLHHEVREVAGLRFAGTPLWFRPDPMNGRYERMLNDFSQIEGFQPWVYEENQRALDFLATSACEADVVVTHHLPSPRSVAARYHGDPLNRFFLCDVEDIVRRSRAPLWVHGHTHGSMDYRVEDRRVVCNPLGYGIPGYGPNRKFERSLVIELGT